MGIGVTNVNVVGILNAISALGKTKYLNVVLLYFLILSKSSRSE